MEYEIAIEAEPDFSEAYIPFLRSLLVTLGKKLTPAELKAVMREAGKTLASPFEAKGGDLGEKTRRASQLLNSLGAITTVEKKDDGYRIVGCSCPLSVAVNERAEVCLAMQSMLKDVIGVPVREECERGERPRCHFAVPA
jgi:predicted ArsR family transcriptional regulator